jgi:hypothetical protein
VISISIVRPADGGDQRKQATASAPKAGTVWEVSMISLFFKPVRARLGRESGAR